MNKNLLYRSIPKVDILLADEGIKVLIETYSRESVMEAIHSEMEKLRAFIGVCEEEEKAKQQIALLNENIAKAVSAMHIFKRPCSEGIFGSLCHWDNIV